MRESRASDTPTTDRLRTVLQEGLDATLQPPGAIATLVRRASPYRTSFPLEELTVVLEDGRRLELMFKNAHRDSLEPEARNSKPPAMYDPGREIEVYRSILSDADAGTARCYAAVTDDEAGRYWLCMEMVPGVELYQVGEVATWQAVATWLATFHARFAHDSSWRNGAASRHLLKIDRTLMEVWLERARTFAGDRQDEAATAALASLDTYLEEVADTLASWPRTLLHGAFYASNILVDDGDTPVRVCPVDWEMAADGPGVIDLAALTAGEWQHDEPGRIARIYLAVQWLGWARDWVPPQEHRHDWAAELARLVRALHA